MALTFSSPMTVFSGGGQMTAESQCSITLDGSYVTAVGGLTLTPAQLGVPNRVFFGTVCVRTSAGNVSGGTLDCTNPQAPKLKLQASAAATAELGTGVGSGAVVDVWVRGA